MFTFLCSIWSIIICLFLLSLVAIVLYCLSLELRLLITPFGIIKLVFEIQTSASTNDYQLPEVCCSVCVLYVQGNIRVRVIVFNATFNNILFIS